MRTDVLASPSAFPSRTWSSITDTVCAVVVTWLAVAYMTGIGGPVRWLAALFFIAFVPGWASLNLLRLGDGLTRVALSVPFSLTVCGAAATLMLWVDRWRPAAMFYSIGGLSFIALIVHALRQPDDAHEDPVPDGIWLGQMELSDPARVDPVSRPAGPADRTGRIFVRLHQQPLGYVIVPIEGVAPSPEQVREACLDQLEQPLRDHLARDGQRLEELVPGSECPSWPAAARVEDLTIVVCTREHPDLLLVCLDYLRGLRYPSFEVMIVDNAPVTDATKTCFDRMVGADERFRYVVEPSPGLSRARNRGLVESRTRWVVFTDDDVRVDPWWLQGIAVGISRSRGAGCVTGIVPPASLDLPSQRYFDRRYSWSDRWEPRVYLPQEPDAGPLYPYSPGIFGTGANFAVDRALMLRLGGFDESLGAGTPAGGGEDLDAFVRVLQAGRTIVYEPSAVVWHVHRGDEEALRSQIFSYGAGLFAFLAKHVADRRTRSEVLRRLVPGLRRLAGTWDGRSIGGRAPVRYVLTEALGMVWGPAALLRSRRWVQRTSRASGPES